MKRFLMLYGMIATVGLLVTACAKTPEKTSNSSARTSTPTPTTDPTQDFPIDTSTPDPTVPDPTVPTTPTVTNNCVQLGPANVDSNDSVQLGTAQSLNTFTKNGIIGIGARVKNGSPAYLFVRMRNINNDGSVGTTNLDRAYVVGAGPASTQLYLGLPAGYMATGFGLAATSATLTYIKIYAAKFNSDGSVAETIVCTNVAGKGSCAPTLNNQPTSRYKESPATTSVLKGVGFGLGGSPFGINAIYAESQPLQPAVCP